MLKNWRIVLIIAAPLLAAAWVGVGPNSPGLANAGVAPELTADPAPQKSTGTPKGTAGSKQKGVAAGDPYIRQLLLLMDTDKNGKVSKQEFMSFMDKEFDRLDVNHDGELDPRELAKIRVRPYLGK